MKITILILLLLVASSFLRSNPIDSTPRLKFSYLAFDKNDNWTIEVTSQFGMKL